MTIKPKCVAFDFDGTLADTNTGILRTFRETFRILGRPIPCDTDISGVIGLTMYDAFPVLCPDLSAEGVKRAVDIYHDLFPRIAFPVVQAFAGIVDMVRTLKERGYHMAVVTARSHSSLEFLAEQIGVDPYFEVMFGAEDVIHCKPSPDLAQRAVEHFTLSPDEVLVVGDATYDIIMGKGAGCHTCAVTWGNQSRERLMTAEPEFVVDTPAELLALL